MRSMELLGPVLTKELKERFRTFKGPLIVFLYVGTMIAISLAFIYLSTRHNQGIFQPGRSREFFIMLSLLQLFLIAFVTPGVAAGTISSERERQTLNVLLTTRLSSASIILSKLSSSLAFTVLLVVATLPVYAMVTLYGGIATNQLAGVFGLYFLNMVFFGSLGVFLSTLIRKTGVSTVMTYGIIFAIVVVTFLGAELLDQYFRSLSMMETRTAVSPYMEGAGQMAYHAPMYQTPTFVWVLRSLNPAIVMVSLFEAMGWEGTISAPWKIYTITYSLLSMGLIIASIKLLPPIKKN